LPCGGMAASLILLYMCPHTAICASSAYRRSSNSTLPCGGMAASLILLYMCPHTAICASSAYRRSSNSTLPCGGMAASLKKSASRSFGRNSSLLFSPPSYSIRQHTSAYVSIRQHTSFGRNSSLLFSPPSYSIRQHTSAYVSIRQHPSAYKLRKEQLLALLPALLHTHEHAHKHIVLYRYHIIYIPSSAS
jgi:hypothetical protein